MSNLHVVFGTGPLGRATIAALAARGLRSRAVNRSGQAGGLPRGVPVEAADLRDPASAAWAARGATAVYHCAVTPYTDWPATLPALMDGAIAAAEAAGARLVYGDNLYAYAPTVGPISEATPERPTTRKGRVRKAVADTLRRAHDDGRVEAAIGRGSDFYGPGVTNSAVGDEVFGRLAAGKRARLLGDPDALHSFTHVRDVGRALVVLGTEPGALGRTWHVPNAPPTSTRAFAERAAVAMGRGTAPSVTPSWVVRTLGLVSPTMREVAEMLYAWEQPFVVDDQAFRTAFGSVFGTSTPLEAGVNETAASALAAVG